MGTSSALYSLSRSELLPFSLLRTIAGSHICRLTEQNCHYIPELRNLWYKALKWFWKRAKYSKLWFSFSMRALHSGNNSKINYLSSPWAEQPKRSIQEYSRIFSNVQRSSIQPLMLHRRQINPSKINVFAQDGKTLLSVSKINLFAKHALRDTLREFKLHKRKMINYIILHWLFDLTKTASVL